MKKTIASIGVITVLVIPAFSYHAEAKTKQISSFAPTALCKDGTYSYSKNHRGTCSHHKGVKKWYK